MPELAVSSCVQWHLTILTVASLAKQAQTPPHVGRRLYDQEMAPLQTSATVQVFISANSGRRVIVRNPRVIKCCDAPSSIRASGIRK